MRKVQMAIVGLILLGTVVYQVSGWVENARSAEYYPPAYWVGND